MLVGSDLVTGAGAGTDTGARVGTGARAGAGNDNGSPQNRIADAAGRWWLPKNDRLLECCNVDDDDSIDYDD